MTIGLVVVFAVVAVYVLLVQVPKDKAASATPTTVPVNYLWTVRADQINGVHIVDRVKGMKLDLVKDAGGAWSLVNPGPQPADQALAASDVSSLTTLAVDGTITTSTDLAAFGVLSPTFTIEVDLAGGSKLKASIGNKSPTGTDYYMLRDGETRVVLLSSASYDTLTGLVATPPVVPPTATATVPTPGPGTPSLTPPPSATLVLTTTVTATGTVTPTPTLPATATATATSTVAATSTAVVTETSTPTTAAPSQTPKTTSTPARTATPTRTASPAKSSATP